MTSPPENPKIHGSDRRATWLELFFDLIFVVAIAKAAHVLLHVHDGHISTDLSEIYSHHDTDLVGMDRGNYVCQSL